MPDNWKHRSQGMRCKTCMFFVPKVPQNDCIVAEEEACLGAPEAGNSQRTSQARL